jgi:deoxycytidine triphosphate deaminase
MAMGLLSANAIKAALASREILIDPPPTEEQFDSDSVDVHLGNTIYRWRGSRAARG